MAYSFSVNNVILAGAGTTAGPVAIWTLIQALVAAGWTVKSDSDGSTYAAAGGQVTGSAAGGHGLNNNNAWIRVQAPAVNGGAVINQRREFVFQRGTAHTDWRIKYSASAGFITGAPTATAVPAAADEVVLIGAGTDSAATFLTWFPTGLVDIYANAVCGGAAEFYSFYFFIIRKGAASVANGLCLDVMQAGSFSPLDVDPAVIFCSGGGTPADWMRQVDFAEYTGGVFELTNPRGASAWLGPTSNQGNGGSLTGNFKNVFMQPWNGMGYSVNLGVNPFTGNDDVFPAHWVRGIGGSGMVPPRGYKGRSTLFLYGSVKRVQLDTATLNTAKDLVHFTGSGTSSTQAIWAPWAGVDASFL